MTEAQKQVEEKDLSFQFKKFRLLDFVSAEQEYVFLTVLRKCMPKPVKYDQNTAKARVKDFTDLGSKFFKGTPEDLKKLLKDFVESDKMSKKDTDLFLRLQGSRGDAGKMYNALVFSAAEDVAKEKKSQPIIKALAKGGDVLFLRTGAISDGVVAKLLDEMTSTQPFSQKIPINLSDVPKKESKPFKQGALETKYVLPTTALSAYIDVISFKGTDEAIKYLGSYNITPASLGLTIVSKTNPAQAGAEEAIRQGIVDGNIAQNQELAGKKDERLRKKSQDYFEGS